MQPKIEPREAWQFFVDGTLAGMALAGECQRLLAWDTTGWLYLIDAWGQCQARQRARGPVVAATISADGQRVAFAADSDRVQLTDARFALRGTFPLHASVTALAIDAQGWMVAIADAVGETRLCDSAGRVLAEFQTTRPIRHLAWNDERGVLLAASDTALVTSIDHKGRELWMTRPVARLGSLAASSAGDRLLMAGFHSGVLRFSGEGQELGGLAFTQPVSRAACDATARLVVAATIEQQIILRAVDPPQAWSQTTPAPIVDVACEPLARSFWMGLSTGQITRFDLAPERLTRRPASATTSPSHQAKPPGSAAASVGSSGAVREPNWKLRLPEGLREIHQLVLLDEPRLAGLRTGDGRLAVVGPLGPEAPSAWLHTSAPMPGQGRVLHRGKRRLVLTNDRQALVYDAVENTSRFADLRLTEVTHVEILGAHELLVVEERDTVSRVWLDGTKSWSWRAPEAIGSLAISSLGIALVTDQGGLHCLSLTGSKRFERGAARSAQLAPHENGFFVIEPPPGTMALVGYDGGARWNLPTPWAVERLAALGSLLLVESTDGQTGLLNDAGHWSVCPAPVAHARYLAFSANKIATIFDRQGVLFCQSFSGRAAWRWPHPGDLQTWDAEPWGLAAVTASDLVWFNWQTDTGEKPSPGA